MKLYEVRNEASRLRLIEKKIKNFYNSNKRKIIDSLTVIIDIKKYFLNQKKYTSLK